jgi:hypothetical protein
MDCSGLVYRVYREATGASLPRTVAALHAWCEPLDRAALQPGDLVFFNTSGPLAHVGIYVGEGRFIHAASEGSETGVTEDSLDAPYWRKAWAGAGRVLPPAEYLGILLSASLGPTFGASQALRGLSASAMVSYRLLGLELGLEFRPSWDSALGVARLPLALSLGLDRELRFFVGPALTIGAPALDGTPARSYSPGGGLAATAGAVWTPIRFKAAGFDWGLYAEIEYDRYLPGPAPEAAPDLDACLRAGAGLRLRWGF